MYVTYEFFFHTCMKMQIIRTYIFIKLIYINIKFMYVCMNPEHTLPGHKYKDTCRSSEIIEQRNMKKNKNFIILTTLAY